MRVKLFTDGLSPRAFGIEFQIALPQFDCGLSAACPGKHRGLVINRLREVRMHGQCDIECVDGSVGIVEQTS